MTQPDTSYVDDTENFNNNPAMSDKEKLTLYLCGLGQLARQIMRDTNATRFSATTVLEPKNGGRTMHVEINVTEPL
jgi:hypothetical protein